MPLEKSKLILEYIKVAAWPSITLIVLGLFSEDISNYISRIESVETPAVTVNSPTSGTGHLQGKILEAENEQSNNSSPEMWFNIKNHNVSQSSCLESAEKSLKDSGFVNGGINNGNTAYGYSEQYVGAFWCIESPRLAFVVVSGPSSKFSAEKVSQLLDTFSVGTSP